MKEILLLALYFKLYVVYFLQVFDPRLNEWSPIASMSVRRSSVGVGVLKNFLYAIGEYDGASRQCLSSVERYDVVRNEWHSVAEMTVKRSGAGVGVLGMSFNIYW